MKLVENTGSEMKMSKHGEPRTGSHKDQFHGDEEEQGQEPPRWPDAQ